MKKEEKEIIKTKELVQHIDKHIWHQWGLNMDKKQILKLARSLKRKFEILKK